MAHPILMPKPGQMTEECVIVAWHKEEGDAVKKGDVLFEIETDKTNMDVEAFEEGVLLKRYVEAGETVPVNALCAYVGEVGEAVPDEAPPQVANAAGAATTKVPPAAVAEVVPVPGRPQRQEEPSPIAAGTETTRSSGLSSHLRISPRASRLAADSGIDPRSITGTGPEGRITERDVRSALDTASADGVAAAAARRQVQAPVLPIAAAGSPAPQPAAFDTGADGGAPQQMSRMRRVIAERLTLSATTVPQFTVTVAVDMTRLVALRTEFKAAGIALTLTDFIVSAVAQGLVEFPAVNSRTDGVSVWPRRRIDIGLAVSVPDGLVVPVIRDAARRSLTDVHVRAGELAEAARNGTLTPDDMTGSTFTISNLGMFGVEEFSAIINPGESAILAVSSVIPTPIVVGDGIGIRQVMKITLTADHRLVDGELAARFLNSLRRRLEDAAAFRGDVLNG
ncbi:MAG: dihydrolipoamide acetyltransferase family protein [Candidatus Limnocylindrales bacterium]